MLKKILSLSLYNVKSNDHLNWKVSVFSSWVLEDKTQLSYFDVTSILSQGGTEAKFNSKLNLNKNGSGEIYIEQEWQIIELKLVVDAVVSGF